MSKFQCPVCGEKIDFIQKYFQSSHGRGLIECPSCKNKLHLKKYGTSSANAFLIIFFAHSVLGVQKGYWPIYILLFVILDFVQRMRSPLFLYKSKKETWLPEWIGLVILILYIIVIIFL